MTDSKILLESTNFEFNVQKSHLVGVCRGHFWESLTNHGALFQNGSILNLFQQPLIYNSQDN